MIRHMKTAVKDKVAYISVGEPIGDARKFTYADLYREVNKLANGLKSLGVKKGDRVSHLHAHDTGAAHCHAGVRQDRSYPQRGLLRLQH